MKVNIDQYVVDSDVPDSKIVLTILHGVVADCVILRTQVWFYAEPTNNKGLCKALACTPIHMQKSAKWNVAKPHVSIIWVER